MRGKASVFVLVAAALAVCGQVAGEIHKFQVDQPGMRNLGLWRLTHDPAIRDYANYHNTQCWSPNGRYTCYTHYGRGGKAGGKLSAEVHVVDLATGKDRLVGPGVNPRWAWKHNWLFYAHYVSKDLPRTMKGTEVYWYDADTGKRVLITHGIESPAGTDFEDRWLYGTQRFRGQKPQFVAVRVPIRPNSKIERLADAPNRHAFVHANPRHPILAFRAKTKGKFTMNRAFLDLDGRNCRIGSVMVESGHQSWRGDGEYWMFGNRQLCGRPWNKPYPSDLETFGWGGGGDVCPGDRNGRYIVYGSVGIMDTRSGDCWAVISPNSNIIFPMKGDNSTLMDTDAKGSPDGTKVHYHSTRGLENAVCAYVTKYDRRKQPDVIHVKSTKGFPESGDLVARYEVIGYRKKTATTFEGLTRLTYGSRPAPDLVRKVRVLWPLSAFVLSGEEKARAHPNSSMLRAGIKKDNPLLYQRQTNCYAVVARLPFRPHLRKKGGRVEIIPGENHCETRGYRLLRGGKPVSDKLVAPGESFRLPGPGAYAATAVEWSGLESEPSLPLKVGGGASGVVLDEKPKGFSWTRDVWKVKDRPTSRASAMKAPGATMELVHLHDGVIAKETWRGGQRVERVDLNEDGKPIRLCKFAKGRMVERVYRTPTGLISSREFYGPDGFKTEYVKFYTRPDRVGREYDHWWYDHGKPVKRTKRKKVMFDATKAE